MEQGHRSLFSVGFSHPKASAIDTAGSNQLPVRRGCPGEVPGSGYRGDKLSLSLFHETFPKWLPAGAPLGCHRAAHSLPRRELTSTTDAPLWCLRQLSLYSQQVLCFGKYLFFFLCTNSSLQHNRPLNLGSSHKRWPNQSIPVFFIKKTIESLNIVRSGCCSIQRDHRHQSKKDQHQIFDIKYCYKQVTGTELASIQHNLTHTSVPQREDNVFSVKFNSECSGLLW